jgi:O-acetyl-ADP-ribose deacetylase (regulator of RNase III)
MINTFVCSIFDSGCDAFVNPVNCVGVMGTGLAKQFKNRFPKTFIFYRDLCEKKILEPGNVYVIDSYEQHPKKIYLATTKYHWKDNSSIFYVRNILKRMLEIEDEYTDINSVAVPMLGAGLGKLDYNVVKYEILTTLVHGKIKYVLCER